MSDADDMLSDLRALMRRVAELPKAVSYIVLDHSCPPAAWTEDEDAYARRYVRCSPSMLDEVRHRREATILDGLTAPVGIPVYRREDLYDGWPNRARAA